MSMTDAEKETFLKTMRERRQVGEQAEDHNREKAKKITDFIYPTETRGQWPETLFKERDRRGLPSLTINRLPAFINQVTGDHLTNRPQIKVRPAGLGSDQKGASNREGMIRQSEQVSRAKFIIDQAYKTMCVSGYLAHWQINTRYISDDSVDEQEIVWEPIEDQFSVIRDPHAKEPDGRDGNWLFILETISNDEWERRYPGKDKPISAATSGINDYAKWFDADSVTIAIYWTRKSKKRTRCKMHNGEKFWKDELSDAGKRHIVKERETDDWTTEVSVCSGTEILSEPKVKPWLWIPVVSVIPPYIMKDGKKWYRASAEDAIDPQRFYNYWKSLNVQHIKPKPTYVTAAMIKGLEKFWDREDKSDLKYLPVNSDGTQWPQDHTPPQVSTAIVQEEQSAVDDIKATLGMWNPSIGASEQTLSGKAIGKLQMAGDKGNMEYVNSLVRALTFTGDIILDMIPHVLDTEREVPTLGFDNTPGILKINYKHMTENGMMIENDMKSGKYRSVVDVGPSFTTQRQEALDAMVSLSTGNPQIATVLAPFMAKFGDWPYADRIFSILKAIQPPNLQPLYDDQQQDGKEQDPRMIQMQAMFEQQMEELKAALGQLQAENEALKQEEQSKIAKIESDREMNAEKIALEREHIRMEMDLKREIAIQEFELKAKKIDAELKFADKKAVAELMHKERLIEQEKEKKTEPEVTPEQTEKNKKDEFPQTLTIVNNMKTGQIKKTVSLKTPEGKEYTGEITEEQV